MTQLLTLALLFAGLCFIAAALIPTLDWVQCTIHSGGISCRPAATAAREAWLQVGGMCIATAYQSPQSGRGR